MITQLPDRNVTLWQDSQETQKYITSDYTVSDKDDYVVVDQTATGTVNIQLPAPRNGRKIYLVNLSPTATVVALGIINAAFSVTVPINVILTLKALEDRFVTTYGYLSPSGGGLTSSDIGITVQPYSVDTVIDANYVHTDNNYTTTEKNKLSGIEAGAEVNVNADWDAVAGDAQILNKPDHNDLTGPQGGSVGEYYHLTSTEYTGTGTGDFVRETTPTIDGPSVTYIDFDTTPSASPTQGRLVWNAADGTLDLGMGYDAVVQQIGLEQYYHVKNQTGGTLLNGRAARAVGTVGNSGQLKVGYATADGTIATRYNLGILTMDIANGGDGYVTSFGLIRGINTTGAPFGETWADGDLLYVSPTTPGYLTKVEPSAPQQKLLMAIVINAASNGSIFVRPTFYGTLNDLQGVYVPTPVDKGYLMYDVDSLRWEQRTQSVGTGLSRVDDGNNVATSLVNFVGDSGTGGMIGAVPAPAAGDGASDNRKYLSADGLWRALDIPAHNELSGLEGGINEGVFEASAFEPTAFQQGVVQFYHLTEDDYDAIVNQRSILSTAVSVELDDSAYTILVTASAQTMTMPEATVARYGRTWTIVQNCNGYVDISPNTGDVFILPGGSDTIRLDQIGSTLSLRCVSTSQWVVT